MVTRTASVTVPTLARLSSFNCVREWERSWRRLSDIEHCRRSRVRSEVQCRMMADRPVSVTSSHQERSNSVNLKEIKAQCNALKGLTLTLTDWPALFHKNKFQVEVGIVMVAFIMFMCSLNFQMLFQNKL